MHFSNGIMQSQIPMTINIWCVKNARVPPFCGIFAEKQLLAAASCYNQILR
jgi:hypothetical protein